VADRAPQATRIPPGRHPLPREFITQHQRSRIISALAEETVEKGYRAVTVADIVRRAGIARNTFYENFSSKEDCFLAASEFAVKEALRRVVDAASKVDTWPARVNAGLGAFLHYVASEPALARTCIVEALSAGPAAVDRYERSIQAFVPLFRMGRKVSDKGDELPDTLEETIVGGIFWILYQRIIMGQAEQIEELLPELVEFSLTPYMGAGAAKTIAAEASAPVAG
jgi:AcrR family transcriptional regulator